MANIDDRLTGGGESAILKCDLEVTAGDESITLYREGAELKEGIFRVRRQWILLHVQHSGILKPAARSPTLPAPPG